MKRALATCLALIAGPAMLAAQAVNQYQPRKFDPQAVQAQPVLTLDLNAMMAPADPACPVSFSAKRGGTGGFVAVKPGQKSEDGKGFSQQVRLSVADDKSHSSVVEAQVTVHGASPRPQVMPVSRARNSPAQISRNMNISFTRSGFGDIGADLALPGYTAVFSIDIDSVTYADGSTWKSAEGMCRVIPDGMMLISAR